MKLIEYIKGRRHGREAHLLEKESMRDPLLSDAIDGFDSVEGSHIERIEEMRHRISKQSHRTNRWLAYVGIAASVLICVTIGGYFIFNDKSDNLIAKSEPSVEERAADKQIHKNEIVSENKSADYSREQEAGRDVSGKESEQASDKQRKTTVKDIAENATAVNEVIVPPVVASEEASSQLVAEDKFQQERMLAEAEIAESQAQNAEIHDDISLENQTTEKKKAQELKQPATGLARAATGQEKKTATRLETPEPKIGWKAYKKYLKDSLRRPDGDCSKSKGTVEVTFHIDENGNPYDFVIGKSLCPDADTEAIRLVKEGGLWTCKSFKRMTVEVKF
ncbi:MAG: hypothetical protein LBV74_11900 [Tannerella sp.]|jgi:outer membrane biosynthesis protein TonB|nr:hypothetical protein [Tannerella sp.]